MYSGKPGLTPGTWHMVAISSGREYSQAVTRPRCIYNSHTGHHVASSRTRARSATALTTDQFDIAHRHAMYTTTTTIVRSAIAHTAHQVATTHCLFCSCLSWFMHKKSPFSIRPRDNI